MKRPSTASTIIAIAQIVLLAACGGGSPTVPAAPREDSPSAPSSSPAAPTGEPMEPGGLEAPPPVTVRFFDQAIDLHAWTYCYKNGCADGAPPEDPLNVGDPDRVIAEFPLSGWSFRASFTPSDERCGRIHTVPLEPQDDGTFVLRPAGYAGEYDVTLSGRGDGDLFTTFRWQTPTDGSLPAPKARLAILADNDGGFDSYGVELHLENLAATPRRSSATITVRADNGEELTFEAKPARGRCFPEGTVYWDGPDDQGLAAAHLGPGPFAYEVQLMLDGERYVARATWPDDEIHGNEPSVRLEFTPELPALS